MYMPALQLSFLFKQTVTANFGPVLLLLPCRRYFFFLCLFVLGVIESLLAKCDKLIIGGELRATLRAMLVWTTAQAERPLFKMFSNNSIRGLLVPVRP